MNIVLIEKISPSSECWPNLIRDQTRIYPCLWLRHELHSLGNIAIQYDLNGNQILKLSPSETFQYTYDPLNQLISAQSEKTQVNFTYDPLGRRISKKAYILTEKKWKEIAHEYYLYHGQQEIGAFTPTGKPKNIKVLGLGANSPSAIAIELEKSVFAPILDAQGNICRLIDPISKEIESRYFYSAFGEELQRTIDRGQFNPWLFASKRLDPELNLIYFGKRYYDPVLARWLTTDPAGFVDSVNLYQYVYNNPFRYLDADGQFAILLPLLIWGAQVAIPAVTPIVINLAYTAIVATTAYWGYRGVEALNSQGSGHYGSSVWDAAPRAYSNTISKRHTPDQESISELVKESGKKGVSNADADTLLDWAKEYEFPHRDDRGKWNEHGRPHWEGGEHIHLGPKHVKVND